MIETGESGFNDDPGEGSDENESYNMLSEDVRINHFPFIISMYIHTYIIHINLCKYIYMYFHRPKSMFLSQIN